MCLFVETMKPFFLRRRFSSRDAAFSLSFFCVHLPLEFGSSLCLLILCNILLWLSILLLRRTNRDTMWTQRAAQKEVEIVSLFEMILSEETWNSFATIEIDIIHYVKEKKWMKRSTAKAGTILEQ